MSPSIDIHAHAIVPEAEAIARKDPAWSRANEETARATGAASTERNRILITTVYRQKFADVEVRLRAMDAMRIDIQAVSPAPLYHYWADRESGMSRLLRRHYGSLVPEPGAAPSNVKRLLRSYFDGEIGCLGAIEWRTAGTSFQRAVWTALTTIAPGETLSYGALAAKLGCPKSVRAVGLANGANPISVVVPCHRVIGTDGSLTGYGGDEDRRRSKEAGFDLHLTKPVDPARLRAVLR